MARWGSSSFYDRDTIVVGSDDEVYVSQVDQNVGNDPTTDPVNWKLAEAGTVTRDVVYAAEVGPVLTDESDGHLYRLVSTAGVLGLELVS